MHPLRAMQFIKMKPPTGLTDSHKWSKEFNDFISCCLKVNPDDRLTAKELLQHPFILTKSKGISLLSELVANSMDAIDAYRSDYN